MNHIHQKIQQMRLEQEAEAGPFFAEISTPEAWREILRWMLNHQEGDFMTQMIEIAAMATWAVEASVESSQLEQQLEAAFSTQPTADQAIIHSEYGPIDQPLPRKERNSRFT